MPLVQSMVIFSLCKKPRITWIIQNAIRCSSALHVCDFQVCQRGVHVLDDQEELQFIPKLTKLQLSLMNLHLLFLLELNLLDISQNLGLRSGLFSTKSYLGSWTPMFFLVTANYCLQRCLLFSY